MYLISKNSVLLFGCHMLCNNLGGILIVIVFKSPSVVWINSFSLVVNSFTDFV